MSAEQAASSAACSLGRCRRTSPPDDDFVGCVSRPARIERILALEERERLQLARACGRRHRVDELRRAVGRRCRRGRREPAAAQRRCSRQRCRRCRRRSRRRSGRRDAVATCGFADAPPPELSAIIVCTAYAPASASTTTRPIAIFFCFSAFALAASATFLRATSSPLLPTSARWRCQPTRLASLWSSRPSTYRSCPSARAPQ